MSTVNHVHTALNKLFNDAERKGLITKNVVRLSTHPTLTAARAAGPEMKVWTPDELATFLRSIDGNRIEAMFRLAALTGMRRGEFVGLRWTDVDLTRRRLTVNQSVTVVDGVEVASIPKTRRSRRVLDLDAATVVALQQHRSHQRERYLRLGVTATASDRVFTTDLGEPLQPNSVGQAFRRLVKEADVPVIRLHDLRHFGQPVVDGRHQHQGRQRAPRPRVGRLHARHLRPRDARPTSGGRRRSRRPARRRQALSVPTVGTSALELSWVGPYAGPRGGTVPHVDIAADLNSEDATGLVWTFLDDAPDPSIIRLGAVVVAGSQLAPAVCEVVDVVEKPAGTVVLLRVLPGTIEQ